MTIETRPLSVVAARHLHHYYGWSTRFVSGKLMLSMCAGMVGIVAPARIAVHAKDRLQSVDACGPVFELADPRGHWVFLADPNGHVLAGDSLPLGVAILNCPTEVELPPAERRSSASRWIVPPHPSRRWLPTLSAVLAEMRVGDSLRVRNPNLQLTA